MAPLTLNADFSSLASRVQRTGFSASQSIAKLSSGNRITRAADDVAAFSIATRMRTHITSIRSASLNAAQATSLLQVAEGGLADMQDALERMNAISVMAASEGIGTKERVYLDIEFQALKNELERIAQITQFNGIPVLNGVGLIEEPVETTVGLTLEGTINPESITGGDQDDSITGLDGNDTIDGGLGDDVIQAGRVQLPGLEASIYQSGPFGAIANLAEAEAIIAAEPVAATFIATNLDYPNGAVNNQSGPVANLLGSDAASLNPPAFGALNTNRMVFLFEGNITVETAGNYSFGVSSDDGFDLQIDGMTVTQFPNNRGFNAAPTTGNVFLTEGEHTFRLVFWENGGSEGLEVFTSLGTSGMVDQNITSYSVNPTDGDDFVDGGEGFDTVTFDGDFADYTINVISETEVEVIDNRANSPNGTDMLVNVEQLRFADGDVQLAQLIADAGIELAEAGPPTLSFNVGNKDGSTFDYVIVDATNDSIFDDPDTLNILTVDNAKAAFDAVLEALDRVTEFRSYVGGLGQQAEYISDGLVSALRNQEAARSVIEDTDVADQSTEFAKQTLQNQFSISSLAQTNELFSRSILGVLENAIGVNDAIAASAAAMGREV